MFSLFLKKVNPNNSVNIEIKGGGGGGGGGSKKNPIPPSPAATKKVRPKNDFLKHSFPQNLPHGGTTIYF